MTGKISMTTITQEKTCWILTNAYQGTMNQAMGLAEAFSAHLAPEINLKLHLKIVKLRAFWYYTAPYFSWCKRHCWDSSKLDLSTPWPDYVIACGRQSVLPALFIKEEWAREGVFEGKKLIFLQNPLAHYQKFDAIVCPTHDKLVGKNVYPMVGATHLLTEEKLKTAKCEFSTLFQTYNDPKIAVILGGPNKYYAMDCLFAEKLCTQLKNLQTQHNASILITTSRRTPKEVIAVLRSKMTQNAYLYTPEESSDKNPYLGLLACADAILVSCESISMVSEACFTTKPVGMIPLPEKKIGWFKKLFLKNTKGIKKFHHFQSDLLDRGRVEWFYGNVAFKGEKTPLRETERIAREMKKI